jgi:hypothetical protein
MKENLELAKEVGEVIVSLFGIIGSLVATYLFLKKRRVAHLHRRNGLFAGNWNNQGQISKVPSHYVDIDAGINKNRFEGRFNVRKGDDERSWQLFGITGKWHFGKFKCKIQKVINGEPIVIATGLIQFKGAILTWKLLDGKFDQFPINALLRRGLPTIA